MKYTNGLTMQLYKLLKININSYVNSFRNSAESE